MTHRICILKGNDPYETTKKLLRKLNFHVNDKKVFIKPNLSGRTNSTATDVNIIRAILEGLKNCDITIGDCVSMKVFKTHKYHKLTKDFDAKLINLNDDVVVWKKIPKPFKFQKIPFTKTVLDCNYLINVSKLKIHALATVTLCLKNLFGTVPKRRNRLLIHPFISRAICDIAQVVHSDFNVIDGIIGNQYDEVISNPVNSKIVLGGYDVLSVDLVGCQCMGVNPDKVEHLTLAKKLFGDRDIEIIGKRIEDVRINFERKRLKSTNLRYFREKIAYYALKTIGSRI